MTDERFEPASAGYAADPEAERIVAEIETTRAEMGDTIDEIGHRLQPQTIVGQARDQLREATVGRVERTIDDAAQTAQHTGNTLMETIRQNPVPAALAAIGIGWLAIRFREQPSFGYGDNGNGSRQRYSAGYIPGFGKFYRDDPRYLHEPRGEDALAGVRETAQRAASGVQQAADEAAERAQRLGENVQFAAHDAVQQAQVRTRQAQWQVQGTISQAQNELDRMLHENPLAVGALAMGLGAVAALAIPETQKERELMGEQRDRLLQQAGTVAEQALDQAEQKAQEVGAQLRSES
jgi:hypothetical protein